MRRSLALGPRWRLLTAAAGGVRRGRARGVSSPYGLSRPDAPDDGRTGQNRVFRASGAGPGSGSAPAGLRPVAVRRWPGYGRSRFGGGRPTAGRGSAVAGLRPVAVRRWRRLGADGRRHHAHDRRARLPAAVASGRTGRPLPAAGAAVGIGRAVTVPWRLRLGRPVAVLGRLGARTGWPREGVPGRRGSGCGRGRSPGSGRSPGDRPARQTGARLPFAGGPVAVRPAGVRNGAVGPRTGERGRPGRPARDWLARTRTGRN